MIYTDPTGEESRGTCTSGLSATARTGTKGSMQLTASVALPARFQPRSAKVADGRLLYEPGGRGKLLTRRSGRPLGKVRLTRHRGDEAAATGAAARAGKSRSGAVLRSPRGAPPIKLTLTRTSRGRARLALTVRHVAVKRSHGCQRLPASISKTLKPFRLETALKLSDGRVTHTVPLHTEWKCRRGFGDAAARMRTVTPPKLARHPGLDVSVTGPRRVIPGSVATYKVRLHNNRSARGNRYVSSLWHMSVHAGLHPAARDERIDARFSPEGPSARRVAPRQDQGAADPHADSRQIAERVDPTSVRVSPRGRGLRTPRRRARLLRRVASRPLRAIVCGTVRRVAVCTKQRSRDPGDEPLSYPAAAAGPALQRRRSPVRARDRPLSTEIRLSARRRGRPAGVRRGSASPTATPARTVCAGRGHASCARASPGMRAACASSVERARPWSQRGDGVRSPVADRARSRVRREDVRDGSAAEDGGARRLDGERCEEDPLARAQDGRVTASDARRVDPHRTDCGVGETSL